MPRHEVQLRARSPGAVGAGAGRRVRPSRARASRLAALSRPGAHFGRVSRMLLILVAPTEVAGNPARATARPLGVLVCRVANSLCCKELVSQRR